MSLQLLLMQGAMAVAHGRFGAEALKLVRLSLMNGLTHRVKAVVPRPMKIRGSHGSPVTAAIMASAAQNTRAHALKGSPFLA